MAELFVETGDLFACNIPAIGHGVNTIGAMGAGIAVLFKRKFPRMYMGYMERCRNGELTPGTTWVWQDDQSEHVVFNIASQQYPGARASYQWLEDAMDDALVQASRLGIPRIAIPQIGCGIGGLEWEQAEQVLREVVARHDVDVHVIVLPSR